MSEKVYVVTRGNYSDYHIITATTDKKTADKVAKKFNAEVEIYDNSEIYTKTIFGVTFNEIGDVKYCYELSEYDYPPIRIDNCKANKKDINLWQDQLMHMSQVIGTFFIFFMEV